MILKRHGRTIKKGWSYQGKLTPFSPDSHTTQSAMMVAVEVDEMSQMSSQLFKGLI